MIIKGLIFFGILMVCQTITVLVHFLRKEKGDNNAR